MNGLHPAPGIHDRVAPGRQVADFIVLDRNFFTIPGRGIANIQVLQTVVGGRVVYQSKGMR